MHLTTSDDVVVKPLLSDVLVAEDYFSALEEQLDKRRLADQFINHLDLLATERQVLALRYLQDQTISYTARCLCISFEQVRNHESKGLRKIRRYIASTGTYDIYREICAQ